MPLLVNLQPAGEYLGEDFYRAGGVPAVVAELIAMGKIDRSAITVNGRTLHENNEGAVRERSRRDPGRTTRRCRSQAGFLNLKGNLFDSAIMKTSRDLGRVPRALPLESRRIRTRSRAAPWSSTAPRTTTRASTTRRSRSTRTPCS